MKTILYCLSRRQMSISIVDIPTCELGNAAVGRSAVARRGEHLGMRCEIVAHINKVSLRHAVEPYGTIVILRSCHRHEDEHDVIDKERCHDNKGGALKLVRATEEIVQLGCHYHGEVGYISKVESLAPETARKHLAEHIGRLASEDALLCRCHDVVEVGQKTVYSSLAKEETAVSACHQGGLPGGGKLMWGLE